MKNQFNKAVINILEDGEGHTRTEMFTELESSLGLSKSQITGRLRQMVEKGIIKNYERGMYRIAVKSKNATGKVQRVLEDIRNVIDNFDFTLSEALSVTEQDKKVIKELEQISLMVDNAMSIYYMEDNTEQGEN